MSDVFNLTFVARKAKTSTKNSYLYVRLTLNQKRKEFGLKISVENDKWDSKSQTVIGRTDTVKNINYQLELIRNKYKRIYSELVFHKGSFDLDEIIARYDGVELGSTSHTLLNLFEEHNKRAKELIGKDYSKGTYQRFHTTKIHLEEFLKTKKKKDIALRDLNNGFLKDMEHYFKTKKDECSHNTSVKYLRIIMKIARLGIEYGYLSKDPFFGFKQHLQEVKRGHLNEEELGLLETTEIANKRIEVIRDMFVFCCYTGLAYADVSSLKPENIVIYKDGEAWINIHRKKTDNKSHILLLPQALAILEKYKNHPECDVTGRVLPLRSNVKFNAYLKEVADLCGITKTLTTHLARHTFATTVTLNNDVPIETVSSMLGHKNIKTTQIYAKILDKKVGNDMKILREKLNGTK